MKRSLGEKTFNVFNVCLMLLLSVIMIYPYLNQVAISFNEGMDTALGGITILPRKFTFQNYATVFSNRDLLGGAVISVSRVILEVVLSIAVVFSAAFGLTRKNLAYRSGLTIFLMIPAYVSAGVIPIYIIYRYLGLINSYWVYIIPRLFVFYNMVIVRSFLQELPDSIEESAKIDGAGDLCIMLKIALPLCKPVLATIALWVSVGAWNDWTSTLYYVTEPDLYPLQYIMMKLIKESEVAQKMAAEAAMTGTTGTGASFIPTSDSIKAATLIITTLPIIMVYPFLQKYFVKGVTVGAVKG